MHNWEMHENDLSADDVKNQGHQKQTRTKHKAFIVFLRLETPKLFKHALKEC